MTPSPNIQWSGRRDRTCLRACVPPRRRSLLRSGMKDIGPSGTRGRPLSPYVVVWSALTLVATAFAVPKLVVTTGGHMGTWNLPLTGALAISAWLPFLLRIRQGFFARLLVVSAVLAATVLLGMNLLDILWFGPDPVF